jgi:hypothetical protein
LLIQNSLLTTVASNQVGTSQWFISKTLSSTRYLLGKAITRRLHVNLTKENFWGGLPWKCHSNVLGEGDLQLVLNFWDITTTISPIKKDVKCHHVGVKTFEDRPIHYLQETHVFESVETNISLCFHCLCQSLVMFLLQCTCDVTQEICNYLSLWLYSKVVAMTPCCASKYLWAQFCTCQST